MIRDQSSGAERCNGKGFSMVCHLEPPDAKFVKTGQSLKKTQPTPGNPEACFGLGVALPASVEGVSTECLGVGVSAASPLEAPQTAVPVAANQGCDCDVCPESSSFLFRSLLPLNPTSSWCIISPSPVPGVPVQISGQLSNRAPSLHPHPNHHLAKLHTYIFNSFNLFSHKVLILHFSRVVWIGQTRLRL